MTDQPAHLRRLLGALDDLAAAANANASRMVEIQGRIERLRGELGTGKRVTDVVAKEPRPLVVELLTANMVAIEEFGSAFRRAEAQALYAEGMTLQEVGDLFGVTRQRISKLVSTPP